MQLRAKRTDKLQEKVKGYTNNLVVKYLKTKGYDCNTSISSMIRINKIIKSENKRVIVARYDEKLSRVGSYFVWNGMLRVKLVDSLTGKEV